MAWAKRARLKQQLLLVRLNTTLLAHGEGGMRCGIGERGLLMQLSRRMVGGV